MKMILSLFSLAAALTSFDASAAATAAFTFSVTGLACTDHGPGQNNPLRARLLISGDVGTSTPALPVTGPTVLLHEALGTRCEELVPTLSFVTGDVIDASGDLWSYPSPTAGQSWANIAGYTGDLWFETQWLVSTAH